MKCTRLAASAMAAALGLTGLAGLVSAPLAQAAAAQDLMISVYIEGSGNNKAIELHNPTDGSLQLGDYTLRLYSNGSTSVQTSLNLPSQELAAGDHFLIVNSLAVAELKARADTTSGVTGYNGDDALTLSRENAVIDSIGQVGFRPTEPSAYVSADGTVSTLNMTLTNANCEVDADPTDAYDPSVNFAASAIDDFTTLGTVNCSNLDPGDTTDPTDPTDPVDPEELLIGQVQGEGETSPYVGETVVVEGTITATYQ